MLKNLYNISKVLLLGLLVFLCFGLTNCSTGNVDDPDSDDSSVFDLRDDTDRAIDLIHEANRNLKSIRVLYNKNNPKMNDLKNALNKKDIKTVKKITEELNLVIIDGYVLAENAKEKIDKAKNLGGINQEFREYLELKSESLDLQIKAFNYRRDTAKLFRDEFGTEDAKAMDAAKAKFIENEKKFAENIAAAEKKSNEADKMWSDSKKKKD